MLDWLRRIDDAIFSPPHRFEILAFVVLRLGLTFVSEADEGLEKSPRRNSQVRSGRCETRGARCGADWPVPFTSREYLCLLPRCRARKLRFPPGRIIAGLCRFHRTRQCIA